MTKRVFAPGCALMIYKSELAEKIHLILNENIGKLDKLLTCCHHNPMVDSKTEVVNICPGCDKRFRNDYQNISTISLWELLAESDFFNFPDYHGVKMSILDACPTRDNEKVQNAIRKILENMNIVLVEANHSGSKSTCCGDSFYGVIPTEKVKVQMKKRTSEMPLDDVIVYCVSCINSVTIGGKNPRYLVDLLFGNETNPKVVEPDEWHALVDEYIEKH
jgi:Fe-S oxidoreductase